MRKLFLGTLFALGLSGCVASSPPAPMLPAGVATSNFGHVSASFLRGVNGSSTTIPAGRPAAILDVTYELSCIADAAQSRFAKAKKILDKEFVVAPLYLVNPRERSGWGRKATQALVGTGCVVNSVSYRKRTSDVTETMLWALRNRVPPAS